MIYYPSTPNKMLYLTFNMYELALPDHGYNCVSVGLILGLRGRLEMHIVSSQEVFLFIILHSMSLQRPYYLQSQGLELVYL